MTDDATTNCIGDASRLARGGAPGDVPAERNLGLASGPSIVRISTLLGAMERAQYHLANLIENFDRLPEAYQQNSDLWQRYDALRDACETISDAHIRWIGD